MLPVTQAEIPSWEITHQDDFHSSDLLWFAPVRGFQDQVQPLGVLVVVAVFFAGGTRDVHPRPDDWGCDLKRAIIFGLVLARFGRGCPASPRRQPVGVVVAARANGYRDLAADLLVPAAGDPRDEQLRGRPIAAVARGGFPGNSRRYRPSGRRRILCRLRHAFGRRR